MLAALAQERRWIRAELGAEVDRGTLTIGDVHAIVDPRLRMFNLARARVRRGPASGRHAIVKDLYATTAQLAFCQRHLRELADDPALVDEVRALRQRLEALARDRRAFTVETRRG